MDSTTTTQSPFLLLRPMNTVPTVVQQSIIMEGWQPPLDSNDNLNIEKLTPLSQSMITSTDIGNDKSNSVPVTMLERPLVEEQGGRTSTVNNYPQRSSSSNEPPSKYTIIKELGTKNDNLNNKDLYNNPNNIPSALVSKEKQINDEDKNHHHHPRQRTKLKTNASKHNHSRHRNNENKHTSHSRKHRSTSRRSVQDSASHRSSSIRSYSSSHYTSNSDDGLDEKTTTTTEESRSSSNDSLSYTTSTSSYHHHYPSRKHHLSSSTGIPLSQSALQGPPSGSHIMMVMNEQGILQPMETFLSKNNYTNGVETNSNDDKNISSLATIGSLVGWNNNTNHTGENNIINNQNLHASMLETNNNNNEKMVEIPLDSLRMMNRNTLVLQDELSTVTLDRDNLISRCDILIARLAQAESDMEKERNAYRNDLSRIEGTLRGKEEIIALLNNQITSMQGQVVQLVSNNGINNNNNVFNQGAIPLSASNSGVTEEDFVLLSEEVQDLQQQLNQARQQLMEHGINAPIMNNNENTIDNPLFGNEGVQMPNSGDIDHGGMNKSPSKSTFAPVPVGNSVEGGTILPSSPVVSQRRRGGLSYDDLANENTRLKQQLVAAQEETAMLRAAQIGIDATKETLETKLRTKEEQFHRLQDALDTTKNQVTEMDKEIKRLSVTLLTSESESDKLRRRATAAEERMDVQLRSMDQLQTNIRTYQSEINELKTINTSKVRELEDLRNQIRQKIQEVADTKQELQNMRDTVRQLQHELSVASNHRSNGSGSHPSIASNRVSFIASNNSGSGGDTFTNNNNNKQRNTHNNNYTSNNWFGSTTAEKESGLYAVLPSRSAVPEPIRMNKPNLDIHSTVSIASPTRHSANPSYSSNNRIFGNEDTGSNNNSNLSSASSFSSGSKTISLPSTPPRTDLTKVTGVTGNNTSKNENIPPPVVPIVSQPQPISKPPTVVHAIESQNNSFAPPPHGNPYTAGNPSSNGSNYIHNNDPFPPILPRNEPLPTYPFNPTTIPPVPIPTYPPVPPVMAMINKVVNPSLPVVPSLSTTVAPPPIMNERARRMAMLADIASSSGSNNTNTNSNVSSVPMNPNIYTTNQPYRPSLGGIQQPPPHPPINMTNSARPTYGAYDSYAIASIQQDPNILNPFPNPDHNALLLSSPPHNNNNLRRGGNKPLLNSLTTDNETIEDSLPFSSIAHRKQEEEEKVRELSRLSKQEADSLAKDREAAAPFATEASVASLEVQIAEKEEKLLQANQSKTSIENELKAIGPSARTVKDRQRKVELESLRETVEKELSEVRRWLKTNVVT